MTFKIVVLVGLGMLLFVQPGERDHRWKQ